MKTEDEYLDRRIQQYRDAPNLEALIRGRLAALLDAAGGVPVLDGDLDDFTGDLLTKIGGILGFPREHEVHNQPLVFGFGEDSRMQIVGFGQGGVWEPAADFSAVRVSIDDDDMFRQFLRAHILALSGDASIANITAIAKMLWGDDAGLQSSRNGRYVIATGRDLTLVEGQYWPVYPRLFPVPLGIRVEFHEGPIRVFGFGEGWGGFREVDIVFDDITGKVFGFDPDGVMPWIGGFNEPAYGDGAALYTSEDEYLTEENGEPVVVGQLVAGARICGRSGAPWANPQDTRIHTT